MNVVTSMMKAGWSGRNVILGTLLAGVAAGSAFAVEPMFYDAKGKAHRLIKSPDEFVVEFDDSNEAAPTRASRMRDAVQGELSAVPWNPRNARLQILKVREATRRTRESVRQMRGIRHVRHVYRFEGMEEPLLSSGRLVVKLVRGLADVERDQMFQDYGLGDVKVIDGLAGVYTACPVIDPDEDEVTCAAALHLDDRVVYAHPDFMGTMTAYQTAPDDVLYPLQWHLDNNGQNGGTPGADIDVEDAWTKSLGEDVVVGIFDDAVDVDHEDLRGNYITGQDAFDSNSDDPRPKAIDDRHGTACLGLICGTANDIGIRGVAPLARFTASRGLNEFLTFSQTSSVYTFARQEEVDVHNNSWGYIGAPDPPIVVDAIETSFLEGRGGRGMVVLFSSGNDGVEITRGFELATLPTVIGVGASGPTDRRTSYSNYGTDVDVLAPSGDDGFFWSMVTTDNDDDAGYAEVGYNNSGFTDEGFPDLPNPNYHTYFSGTSAACPVASGVAALCLAVNPNLTATQVRCIMEHTSEKVSTSDAGYDAVTGRSFTYGYGRINARDAVDAADLASTNGGLTWPDRLGSVVVSGNTISWDQNDDLRVLDADSDGENDVLGDEVTRVLVLQSAQTFSYVPPDGSFVPDPIAGEFHVGTEVATGVCIAHNTDTDSYTINSVDCPGDPQVFALFAANAAGNYSWGVLIDAAGNVVGGGEVVDSGGGGGDDDEGGDDVFVPVGSETPKVSITVTPSSGQSPLVVEFQANALSDSTIVATEWDFGDGSVVSTSRTTTHTYEVSDGTARTYIATFTATDEEQDQGSRSFAVNILAGNTEGGSSGEPIAISILAETPGAAGSDRDTGTSPFTVNFSFDASNVPDGAVVTSVLWDLGDGNTATSLSVPHTYYNTGTADITIPVTLTLTYQDVYGQTLVPTPATRLIVVNPGTGDDDVETPTNDGGGGGGTETPTDRAPTAGDSRLCGLGALYLFPLMFVWFMVRRR